jgi:hypothetical protein
MQSRSVLRFVLMISALAPNIALSPRFSYAAGGEPRYFAIKNARIVPVSGPVIENGTVVIANGLIQSVGSEVTIPPEAWVIDGKGLTVYPGFIDAGTTIGLPKHEEEAGREGKGRRRAPPTERVAMGPEDRPSTTPWRIAADELKLDDKRIETWRNAGFTTTVSIPDVGIFPGQGTLIDLAGERSGEMVVKSRASLVLSFNPTGGFFAFPGSLMGVIAYVRQVLDDTRWHAQAEGIYEAHVRGTERPPYDRAELFLEKSLERKELFLVPANNSVEILRGLKLAQEWDLRAALYGGQQGYEVANAIAAGKMPVLVNLKWPEKPKDADPEAEETLRGLRFRDRAPSTPAVLAKAGVKFGFYSDGLESPKDIHKNLKKALDAGLSPDTALRAFTLDSADILGVADRLGSIEPGKIANLTLTDGDFFNEKTKVKHVFVDGRWFQIHEETTPPKPQEKPTDDDDGGQKGAAGVER